MIKEIQEKYIFTDEDIKLLSRQLPEDPCEKCDLFKNLACLGCNPRVKYDKDIQPYIDANIYDIALIIKKIRVLKQKQKEINDAIKINLNKLPEEIQKLIE